MDLCTQPVWTSRNVEAPGGDNRSAITDIRYDPETLPTTERRKKRVCAECAPPPRTCDGGCAHKRNYRR